MKQIPLKKLMVALPVTLAVTAGTVRIALDYQSETGFHPFRSNREIQNNQVLFPEGETAEKPQKEPGQEKSALWEKDPNAAEQSKPQEEEHADYLFENGQEHPLEVPSHGHLSSADPDDAGQISDETGTPGVFADDIYQLTDDPTQADLTVHGGGTDSGTGNGETEDEPSAPETPVQPGGSGSAASGGTAAEPSQPSQEPDRDSGGGGGGGGNSGNSGTNPAPAPTPTPTPDPTPTPTPADTAKDPQPGNQGNTSGGSSLFPTLPYKESTFQPAGAPDETGDYKETVVIGQDLSSDTFLYLGQKVDAETVFYSLNPFAWGTDKTRYAWSADDLGVYFRIEGISLDGGVTWMNEFPMTLPETLDSDEILIRTAYRFSTKTENWIERQVSYEVAPNRIFLLKQPLLENDVTLDAKMILNSDSGRQHYPAGTLLNLLYWQDQLMNSAPAGSELTALFPGWTENGKPVSWMYPIETGRHILEPLDTVPVPDGYQVKWTLEWLPDDANVSQTLTYYQTLTYAAPEVLTQTTARSAGETCLTVPQYVQAVDISAENPVSADVLELPDTVLEVRGGADSGLRVRQRYVVADGNPAYQSTEDGLLLNKDATELCGIPSQLHEITVPSTITSVQLTSDNELTLLHLQSDSLETLPDIDYSLLRGCKVAVSDSLRSAFLQNYGTLLEQGGNSVVSADDPEQGYTIVQGAILDASGTLCGVLNDGRTSLTLPDQTTAIAADAFADAPQVQLVLLPQNGAPLRLSPGCFQNSGVNTILCFTQAQADSVRAELSANGPAGIQVQLTSTARDGSTYYRQAAPDGTVQATLLHASPAMQTFDGTLTAESGEAVSITAIGERAFADCQQLQWAALPECVTAIGTRAFYGCSALEGILIDAKDTVSIGDLAFDNCKALRFVASNAMHAVMENGYDPLIEDSNNRDYRGNLNLFFVPTNSDGYGENIMSFTVESDVAGYCVRDIGNSCKMLYGINAAGDAWLALRSGREVADAVELPETTVELFSTAMASTVSPSGVYTVNWENLPNLEAVDMSAFLNAQLGGEILFPESVFFVGTYAFTGCTNLEAVSFPGTLFLGEQAFTGCSNLRRAEFGGFLPYAFLQAGTFSECDQLTDLTFGSAPQLSIYGSSPYRFNLDWSSEEEAQHLRLHFLDETQVEPFIKAWRYLFLGYTDGYGEPPYLVLWADVQWDNLDFDSFEFPADELVDTLVKQKLLDCENNLRTMFGLEPVTEPTDFYPYRETNGNLTLVGAPSYIEEVTLDAETLEMPEGWYLDYIGIGAFSNSPNLSHVTVPEGVSGLEPDAFAGVSGDSLTLDFEGTEPPELLLDSSTKEPFSFGVDDTVLHIQVPDGCADIYLAAWVFPLTGYRSFAELQSHVIASLGEDASQEDVAAEIARIVLPAENRLRSMMGLELVSAPSVLSTKLTEEPVLPPVEQPEVPAETPSETPEEPSDEVPAETPGNNTSEEPSETPEEPSDTPSDEIPEETPTETPDITPEEPSKEPAEIPEEPTEPDEEPADEIPSDAPETDASESAEEAPAAPAVSTPSAETGEEPQA